ncbi:hypothetical protein [Mucilaginibacter sp. CSA2-8R]|uniref:hypothetical protein n=1 Tax=Mucilaginibacter sp. CSA2-8R TaxID=3141542 RepID=UPI00315CC2EA
MQQDHHPYNDIFKQLLINPGRLNEEQMNQLQMLVDRFPQMGLLYALQARYSGDTAHLSRAAAGFADSTVLQKIVLRTSGLPAVNESQIIFKNNDSSNLAEVAAETVNPVVEESQPEITEAEPVAEIATQPEEITTLEQPSIVNNQDEPAAQTENLLEESVAEPAPVVEDHTVENTVEDVSPAAEDVEPVAEEMPTAEPDAEQEEEPVSEPATELPVAAPVPLPETQQLIIENIAASNYFVFDAAFIDRNKIVLDEGTEKVLKQETAAPQEASAANVEEGQVTRYHDDKMPYSFLWWLDKTRSKHSADYQPYTSNKPVANAPAEKTEPVTEVPEERKKEDGILERFLQEDPQIKPPTGDKLDNENKARHSSEDQDEMITETLARIYADQMLYSKAIAAYKILILKNPEKRRYFANQIEILQKKIN